MSDHAQGAIAEMPVEYRWDYSAAQIHARHVDQLEAGLREHGELGWELVFMHEPNPNDYVCVFKRARCR